MQASQAASAAQTAGCAQAACGEASQLIKEREGGGVANTLL